MKEKNTVRTSPVAKPEEVIAGSTENAEIRRQFEKGLLANTIKGWQSPTEGEGKSPEAAPDAPENAIDTGFPVCAQEVPEDAA